MVYRVSPITYAIAKRVVTVPHVAMANLIAGKRVVPELIQNDFTASNIVRQLQPLLPDGPPAAVHDAGAGSGFAALLTPRHRASRSRRRHRPGGRHYAGDAWAAASGRIDESVHS